MVDSKANLANLEFQKNYMSEAIKDYPDDQKIAARYEKIVKQYNNAQNKHKALTKKVNEAQNSYDTTPAGQKELESMIEEENKKPLMQRDVQAIISLRRRQKVGHTKRAWSMLAYKRSQAEKNGNTIKKQRGNFITFKDRNASNQEIIHEKELVSS